MDNEVLSWVGAEQPAESYDSLRFHWGHWTLHGKSDQLRAYPVVEHIKQKQKACKTTVMVKELINKKKLLTVTRDFIVLNLDILIVLKNC